MNVLWFTAKASCICACQSNGFKKGRKLFRWLCGITITTVTSTENVKMQFTSCDFILFLVDLSQVALTVEKRANI